jgi:hypothetical protein
VSHQQYRAGYSHYCFEFCESCVSVSNCHYSILSPEGHTLFDDCGTNPLRIGNVG